MGYSRKNPHPHVMEGMLENLTGGGGGGVKALEIQQEGGSEPKNTLCILGFHAGNTATD